MRDLLIHDHATRARLPAPKRTPSLQAGLKPAVLNEVSVIGGCGANQPAEKDFPNGPENFSFRVHLSVHAAPPRFSGAILTLLMPNPPARAARQNPCNETSSRKIISSIATRLSNPCRLPMQ
jgi:hypothetical protein